MSGKWINPLEISSFEYSKLTGTPYVTVSPTNSDGKNEGADYGPGTSGTTTSGINEALNSLSTTGGIIMLLTGTFFITTPISFVMPSNSDDYAPALTIKGQGNYLVDDTPTLPLTSSFTVGSIIYYNGSSTSEPIMAIGADVYNSAGNKGDQNAVLKLFDFGITSNGNDGGGLLTVNWNTVEHRIITDNIAGAFLIREVGGGNSHIKQHLYLQGTATSNQDGIHITGIDTYSTYTVGSQTISVTGRPEGAMFNVRTNLASVSSGSSVNGIHIDDANNWGMYDMHGSGGSVGIFLDNPAGWSSRTHSYGIFTPSYSGQADFALTANGSNAYTIWMGGSNFQTGDFSGSAPIMYYSGGSTSNGVSQMTIAGLGSLSAVGLNKINTLGGGTSPTSITPPSSGSSYTNSTGYNIVVTVGGGTVSNIAINGTNTGATQGAFPLKDSDTIAVTYSSTPTMYYYQM